MLQHPSCFKSALVADETKRSDSHLDLWMWPEHQALHVEMKAS